MNQVHFLSLFLIHSIANVQARLKAEGIVGGDHAAEGQYGYQVSLSENGISFCGGGIIDDHYVVTAAHCLKYITRRWTRIPFLQVTAGTSDLRSSSGCEVIVDVEEVFMPREYDRTDGTGSTTGDIAVLKLKQSLNIDDHPNLRKLKLPSESQKVDWAKAVVTGFGWNEVYMKFDPNTNTEKENGGRSDGKMRYAHATVMDPESCAKYMAGTAKHLCAAVVQRHAIKHEGICSADSGSPLVYRNTLIGVVSTSPVGCVENNFPAVYTRVSYFVNFIRGAMDGKIDEDVRHLVFHTKG